jgi:hypothetical protein
MDLYNVVQRHSAIMRVLIVSSYIEMQSRIDKESKRRFTAIGVWKQKPSPMTNLSANASLLVQLFINRFQVARCWDFSHRCCASACVMSIRIFIPWTAKNARESVSRRSVSSKVVQRVKPLAAMNTRKSWASMQDQTHMHSP